MTSYINMSLEDIIQKKKGKNRVAYAGKPNKFRMTPINEKSHIPDARNKIISKKRIQITDAREKLAELAKRKDARIKLDQLRQKRARTSSAYLFSLSLDDALISSFTNQGPRPTPPGPEWALGQPPTPPGLEHHSAGTSKSGVAKLTGNTLGRNMYGTISENNGKWKGRIYNNEKVFLDHSRQVRSQPRQLNHNNLRRPSDVKRFMENRSIGRRDLDDMPRLKPILRTVENDKVVIVDDDDDLMEGDYSESRNALLNRKASLNFKITAHNDVPGKPGSLRRTESEKEKSPPRLTSILKKRPMAAVRNEKKSERMDEGVVAEYRIIVSNLRNSVTSGDIQELFGDVGGMMESRLVRPGTAEVIYKSQEDAQRAVELYHNRQLDGQPMNCLLVTPRATAVSSRCSGSSSNPSLPPSTNSNVEPDLSTFHKVLFSSF